LVIKSLEPEILTHGVADRITVRDRVPGRSGSRADLVGQCHGLNCCIEVGLPRGAALNRHRCVLTRRMDITTRSVCGQSSWEPEPSQDAASSRRSTRPLSSFASVFLSVECEARPVPSEWRRLGGLAANFKFPDCLEGFDAEKIQNSSCLSGFSPRRLQADTTTVAKPFRRIHRVDLIRRDMTAMSMRLTLQGPTGGAGNDGGLGAAADLPAGPARALARRLRRQLWRVWKRPRQSRHWNAPYSSS